MPRRPSERSVSSCLPLAPLADLTWVMTSSLMPRRAPRRPARAPPGSRRRSSRPRRGRARRLREDVVNPGELEHRAHAAAGDHAGTGRGGLEEHAARAVDARGLVRDRRAVARHAEEVLLRALDALLDRQRDLVGLAIAVADDPVLVADNDERGEREAPAALDHLRDAVDLNDALLEVEAGRRNGSIGGGHGSFEGSGLEVQAALAGALGQGLDTAVVLVAAAVEHDGLDAGGLRALGQQGAGLAGLLHRLERPQVGLRPVDGGQRAAGVVVDELGEDAPVRAEDADARALGGAVHLRADAAAALEAPRGGVRDGHARLPTFRGTYSPW